MATLLTLDDFKVTTVGRRIGAILDLPDTLSSMEDLSRRGRPAVLAIDRALADQERLDDTEKRHVGRWIREKLSDRGWKVAKRLHFRSGRIFSSGAVYERPHAPPPPPADAWPDLPPPSREVSERLRAVQEMVRRFSKNDYSVDDFIAEKRAEAAREL